jgi:predicted acetyltransferase
MTDPAPLVGGDGSGQQLRELTGDEREQALALSVLAFGGERGGPVTPQPAGSRTWGVLEGDRLLATATWRSYAQWWGGRPVPMGGVAGVAVHPDGRGQGAATRLVRVLLGQLRGAGQPISVLFPTAPGIYRPLGWELVGRLDETVLPTAALRTVRPSGAARVRTAGLADVPTLTRLWHEHGRATDGALTRDGPSSPRGLEKLLAHDVVALAEQDGRATGYLAYDRGRGYGAAAELLVAELVAQDPAALSALLASLASWDAVAGSVRWTGPLDEVALALGSTLPTPGVGRPWMLRIADAPAAVAARGWRSSVRAQAAFTLVDPEVPDHEGPWLLTVQDGVGRLDRAPAGSPRLDVRGLALLYAGAGPGRLLRAGLLEAPVPGLDACAGPAPVLLDYF